MSTEQNVFMEVSATSLLEAQKCMCGSDDTSLLHALWLGILLSKEVFVFTILHYVLFSKAALLLLVSYSPHAMVTPEKP